MWLVRAYFMFAKAGVDRAAMYMAQDLGDEATSTGKYGTSGVICFGIKGGRAAATKFMDSLKLAAVVTHVADARTCVLHPASTTHRQLTDEQLIACGVSPDLVRFSVGIEDAEDIIADIAQALEKCN